jgi:uncharacterized protein
VRFQWEERKRQANLAKHGLDFFDAEPVFEGDHYSYPSPRNDEQRWVTVGRFGTRLVAVIWTPRGDIFRITSFRIARDGEKRRYRDLYG